MWKESGSGIGPVNRLQPGEPKKTLRLERRRNPAITEETGNDIYPPAKETLHRHGIPFDRHYARQIDREAFERYDLIICADRSNLRAIERMFGTSPKLTLMMHWAGEDRDVSDPWYTRDFDTAFRDIYTACEGLLKHFSTPQKII